MSPAPHANHLTATTTPEALDWRFVRTDHLMHSATSTFGGTFAGAGLLVVVLWDALPHSWLLTWFFALSVLTGARYRQLCNWHQSGRDAASYERGNRQFFRGTTLAGILWSSCWLAVPPLQSSDLRYFVVIILCGVTAGSIPSLSAMQNAARVFLSLVILPAIPIFIFTHAALAWQIAVAALIYASMMMRLASRVNDTLANNIRQRAENEQLIGELSASKIATEHLNVALSTRIEQQQSVEHALIKARDQAELASRAKSEFLANMSHEIRTPMNGVLGMTELLLATELTKKQRRFAANIRNSGEALLSIINDILDFSKIEAGKLELNPVIFDLHELLENIAAMFAERAERAGLAFACTYPPGAHAAFRGDAVRVQQILTNLIGNALKFTQIGEVRLEAHLVEATAHSTIVKFEVKDTGIGIPAPHLAKIFDSFSQADNSITRRFGGTGLGLAICKQLADLMGGEIGVTSAPDHGSTFWFTCPLRKEQAARAPTTRCTAFNGRRILIADDSIAPHQAVGHQLTAWGVHHRTVVTDEEATAALAGAAQQGTAFDCVIVDYRFAGRGTEFVARYRKSNPPQALPKFIMLTNISSLQSTGQWIDAGVSAYVQQPIRRQELIEALAIAFDIPTPSAAETTNSPHALPEQTRFDTNILVAEDNLVNQELIRGMLESLGCRVHVESNGRELLKALLEFEFDARRDPFQLVLMDCQMPELDGFSATRTIREHELRHGNAPIPIVAITANALDGDREACLAAGMNDYLSKPFTRVQLTDMLRRWLPLSAAADPPPLAPTPTIAPTKSILDPTALRKIRDLQRRGAPDILAKVAKLYRENSPRLFGELRAAARAHDAPKLMMAAHTLKSSSASLGAAHCAALCGELEALGRAANLGAVPGKIEGLELELEKVYQALAVALVSAAA